VAGLFVDDVFGVPVWPILVVPTAVPFLVFAMGGSGTPERACEFLRRAKVRALRFHTPRQSRCDLLEKPAVAIRVTERRER
jgi:hypothetical protein